MFLNGAICKRPIQIICLLALGVTITVFRAEETTSALAGFHASPLSCSNCYLAMLVFVNGWNWRTQRQTLESRLKRTTNSTHIWDWARFEPRPHWWEANNVISTPSILPAHAYLIHSYGKLRICLEQEGEYLDLLCSTCFVLLSFLFAGGKGFWRWVSCGVGPHRWVESVQSKPQFRCAVESNSHPVYWMESFNFPSIALLALRCG